MLELGMYDFIQDFVQDLQDLTVQDNSTGLSLQNVLGLEI
jgi:hypothetical protein